jgi:hypothetical protein
MVEEHVFDADLFAEGEPIVRQCLGPNADI